MPTARKGHRVVGMRARVVEDLARLRGKCSLNAKYKNGITPAQAVARLALQHVFLLKEYADFMEAFGLNWLGIPRGNEARADHPY